MSDVSRSLGVALMSDSQLNIPIPGLITANYIDKTKVELREEFKASLEAQAELLKTGGVGRHEKALLRIEAIEKAHDTFKEDLNRFPTRLDREVERVTSLFAKDLATVNIRIDTFHAYAKAMRKAAKELTAAMTNANATAVTKSETAMNKEIDGIKGLINSISTQFDTQINNLADRINRSEGMFAGGKGVVGIIIAIVGAAGIYITSHNGSIPTVGADTKRVDDLIAVMTEQARQTGQRIDALSARLNSLTPPQRP
jgi:hypothetical protein